MVPSLAHVPGGEANTDRGLLVTLEGLSSEASDIEDKALALVDRLNKRVASFRDTICECLSVHLQHS